MIKIQSITDSKYQSDWNRAANHPLQTWEWGEQKQLAGNKIVRLAEVEESGKLKQVYLFTVHSLPGGLEVINYAKGEWPPVAVLKYLCQHYAERSILVKLEPEVFLEEAGKYRIPLYKKHWEEKGLSFKISHSSIFARYTFSLDLSGTEAEILSGMKSKTRYNLNLANRKGVKVVDETASPQAFELFYSLYHQTVKRQGYLGHSRAYHNQVWEIMKTGKMARILVAYYNGQPLSSYLLLFFKGVAYYLYGGSSEEHKEVMASNLLMWESIKLAKKLDCHTFDLWGALAKNYSPSHPWAGFHRFKEGYGGLHRSYLPTIDLVLRPLYYQLFSFVWPIRTWILEKLKTD
jgi:lipid II:glycine glycyltransferase (peptidoglycan interpeptide bridge formation enzyme)